MATPKKQLYSALPETGQHLSGAAQNSTQSPYLSVHLGPFAFEKFVMLFSDPCKECDNGDQEGDDENLRENKGKRLAQEGVDDENLRENKGKRAGTRRGRQKALQGMEDPLLGF